MHERSDDQRAADAASSNQRLESWKAIANYLGRTVRTAHRWEKDEGLPIHRHLHQSQSTVYAYTVEIDAWWEARKAAPRRASTRTIARRRLLIGAIAVVALFIVLLIAWSGRQEIRSPSVNSIAVLPFEAIDGTPDSRMLGHAIAEELLNQLARIPELTVIARASSFAFGDAGIEVASTAELLGVGHIIVGTLQDDGERIRVNARLIDAAGHQLWARSFDHSRENLFALQDDVAQAVVESVAPQLGRRFAAGAAPHPDAYQYFLLGRENLRLGRRDVAAEALRRALSIDPGMSDARGMLAYALALMSGQVMDRVTYEEAAAAADLALESDPESPMAHLATGILAVEAGEPDRATESLARAVRNDPNLVDASVWLSRARQATGHLPRSDTDLEHALRVDPLHPEVNRELAMRHWARGDFEAAHTRLLRLLDLPRPPRFAYVELVMLCREFGRLEESIYWSRQAAMTYPRFTGLGLLILGYDRYGLFDYADFWLEQLALAERGVPRLGLRSESLYLRGRVDEIIQLKKDYIDRAGLDLAELPFAVQETFGGMQVVAGNHEEGIAVLEPWFGPGFELPQHLGGSAFALSFAQMLVHAYQATGRQTDAQRLLNRIDEHLEMLDGAGLAERPNLDLVRARQAALRGRDIDALRHLQDAIDKGWRDLSWDRPHPAWGELLDRDAFRTVLAKVENEIGELRRRLRDAGPDEDFRETVTAVLSRDLQQKQ